MSDLDPGKSTRAAKRASDTQRKEMEKQKQLEQMKIAEEEDVIGRKKALAKSGGRSLLIATSPLGVSTQLGGGTNA